MQLYLERASVLHNLRLTSSRLKDFSDAVAHRNMSLIDDEVHEQITYRLAERLIDPSDKICHYVRNLHVVNFKGDTESYCLNHSLITDCLEHAQRLGSFSWESDAPMPVKTLEVLRHRFPTAQVCAKIRTTDKTLLSSAQLHRLEISIPCLNFYGDYSISLFGALKQALLRLDSLRQLSIDTHIDANIERLDGNALDHLQIPLHPGEKLPALVALELRSKNYAFDVDHCNQLRASVDCNKLQRLILGSSDAGIFFETFQGATPSLTHLDVSYASSKNDPRHRRLGALAGFVSELTSLKRLVFRCDELDLRADFPKMLAEKHGCTLVDLSLQAIQENSGGPTFAGNIRKFLWKFTNMQRLDMAFPDVRSYHRRPDCEGYQWGVSWHFVQHLETVMLTILQEANHFSFVPPLPSLRNANLSIRSPPSEGSLYAFIDKHAHCAICHLWTTFVDHPKSQLETLSIRFWRWEMTGRQTSLEELIYDTTRLRGQLLVKIRHHREIPRVVYREVWEDRWDRRTLTAFEVTKPHPLP